jgi:hypothetical protein
MDHTLHPIIRRHHSADRARKALGLILIVLAIGLLLYLVSNKPPTSTTSTNANVVETNTEANPVPAAITNTDDLTAAEQALDRASVEEVTTGLDENDRDVNTF